MIKQGYEYEILINGKPVKEYYKDGKTYVEGRKGNRFSIRVRNNTGKRILAIPSVDGLSVMNGKEASFDSSGYIIKPYDALTIDGWRVSDKEVAQFYFADQARSYAAKMDRDGNTGVIGLAIFAEKFNELEEVKRQLEELSKQPKVIEKHIHHHDHYRYCNCWQCNPTLTWYSTSGSYTGTSASGGGGGSITVGASALNNISVSNTAAYNVNMLSDTTQLKGSSMSLRNVRQELGTGWGESKRSEVRTVDFERANSPEAVFEIFYNTREQLQNMGVDFNTRPVYVAPQAFPNEYCEPPVK